MSHWHSFRYIFPIGTVVHVVVKYDFSFKTDEMSFTVTKIKVLFTEFVYSSYTTRLNCTYDIQISCTETVYFSYTFRLHDRLYIRHILLNGSSLYFIILCQTEKQRSVDDQSIKSRSKIFFLSNDIVINEIFQCLEVLRTFSGIETLCFENTHMYFIF